MKRMFFHFRRLWLQRAILLCRSRLGERGMIVALAFFIGAAGAVAAALLKMLVAVLEKFSLWIFNHPGEALERLKDLINTYDDPQTPYLATPDVSVSLQYNDFDHLARFDEWASSDSSEQQEE